METRVDPFDIHPLGLRMYPQMAALASQLHMGHYTQSLTVHGTRDRPRTRIGDLSLLSAFPRLERLSLHNCSFRYSKGLPNDVPMQYLTVVSIDCVDLSDSEALVRQIIPRCPKLQHIELSALAPGTQSDDLAAIQLPSLGLTDKGRYLMQDFLAESAYRPRVLSITLGYMHPPKIHCILCRRGRLCLPHISRPNCATKLRLTASGGADLLGMLNALASRLREACSLQVEISMHM